MFDTDSRSDSAVLADVAVSALSGEATLTPKPGLVDRNGSGGHDDMTLPMLLASAEALRPTFVALAGLAALDLDRQSLRDRVGALGRDGERAMLAATGGVNTHRGALWTVGLLVTAAAATPVGTGEGALFARAADLAATADSARKPISVISHGQRARQAYGATGAVGEALAGFPHIREVALPALRTARWRGDDETRARLVALIALVATVDDTCVLHRGGTDGLRWAQESAGRVLGLSDHSFPGALRRFADEADRRRLSPGGSADLLAGALFVDSLGVRRDDFVDAPLEITTTTPQEAQHAHQ